MAAKKPPAKKSAPHSKPWASPMPHDQFERMRAILAAPSPIGMEAAMTTGVIEPMMRGYMPKGWAIHRFKGHAGLVLDTCPGDTARPSIMLVGHADKIRMQVRSIADDGKIYLNTDSFLPNVIVGHEVLLFSEQPEKPGHWRRIEGGTIEGIGAIHFSEPAQRSGEKGLPPESIYLELQMHGEKCKERLQQLGLKAGDPVILHRPIRRGFSPDTFYGAYLDNGLGCFMVTELGRLLAQSPLKNLRVLLAIATHEEIGRFGAAALAGDFRPDVLIGTDVGHDYDAAPNLTAKRMNPEAMGKGFALSVGSIITPYLNQLVMEACQQAGIPVQPTVVGRDTGTDAMGAALAGFDCVATSIGFPIRNMHTISETGHTHDVLGALHGMLATLHHMDAMNRGKGVTRDDFRKNHPRLDQTAKLGSGW
jgi:putative aminopeptidase FrvX